MAAVLAAPLRAGEAPDDLVALTEAVQERCYSCHAGDTVKGGLALDQASGWLKGVDGKDPEDSELYYRITLPADDPDAMPPKGDRLGQANREALGAWIRGGAEAEPLASALEGIAASGAARTLLLDRIREASGARIDARTDGTGTAGPDADLMVTWSHAPSPPTTAQVAALEPIAGRITDLSFAGLRGDVDGWLRAAPRLPRATRVHLERSSVTDTGVTALLKRAPALEYINLHSTAVTPRIVDALGAMEAVLFGTAAAAPAPRDPFASLAASYPRRILAADASKKRAALLMETAIGSPVLLWERPTSALHDLQWLGETEGGHGRVLMQESWQRVVEVDTATNEVLWSYDASPKDGERVEIHSFERLEDGTTMIAESGRARILIVTPGGEVANTIPLKVDHPDPHHDTRLVQPTPEGTFLVAHERDGVVREYDSGGDVVWSYEIPLFERDRAPGHGFDAHGNQTFAALRLKSGNTVISTGNGHGFLCVDPAGTILWHIAQSDLDGVRFAWTTSIQELSNGRLILGNCHAGPDQPQAVEIDAKRRVQWRFRDFERFGNAMTGFVVIERTGSATGKR